MKLVKIAICAILLTVMSFVGYRGLQTGTTAIPAFLKLFSPFEGFWQNAEGKGKDISLSLDDVQDDIKIVFDERLVPHIYAQNIDDALFAQGYLHAKYRLFQCDLSYRAIQGRLSEIIGDRTIEIDREKINKGYRKSIVEINEHWSKDTENYELLNAYCAGFNSFLDALNPRDYPIEFKLLSYDPSQWSGEKVVSVMKSMQDILSSRHFDVAATNTLAKIGKEDFDKYFPDRNPKQTPIIPNEGQWNGSITKEKAEINEDLGNYEIPFPNRHDPFIGSNNWVISPGKSKSNRAILCNDPHLNLTLPSIWYELEIHTPEISAHGVSIPGAPGIIIGFNEKIAWGVTNVGHDITDYFAIDWKNQEKTEYNTSTGTKKIESLVSKIEVKNSTPIFDTTNYTTWGPIFYSDDDENKDLAMRWVGNEIFEKTEMPFFLNLMQANSRSDFDKALEHFAVPAQNIVYADVEGNIGLDVEGQLPLRRKGEGRFIASSQDLAAGKLEYIPKSENPASFNPTQGYLASANQASTDTTYPYYYLGNFDDYRGRLINKFLQSKDKHSLEDLKSYQNSDYSIYAEEALKGLLSLVEKTDLREHPQIVELKSWDYHFTSESKVSILFESWYEEFYLLLWDEFAVKNQLKPEDWMTVSMMSSPSDKIYDVVATEKIENGSDIAVMSFNIAHTAYQELEAQGIDNWSQYKSFDLKHLSRIPAFGRMDLETSGHQYALNSVRKTVGPSWKMLVEMNENPTAHVVYPGGQSGNPGSKHYDDMLQTWLDGDYYEVGLQKDPGQSENMLFTISMKSK